LGNYWSGQISAAETIAQTSFRDFNTNLAVNNQATNRTFLASAFRQLDPHWKIGSVAQERDVSNSDPSRLVNNYKEKSLTLDLAWNSSKGSTIGGRLRIADARYPNRQIVLFAPIDNSYSDHALSIYGVWPYSGFFRFSGSMGYEKRQHQTVTERDFSGLIGDATADYFLSGKTTISLNIYRRLNESNDLTSSYRVASGVSLNGLWAITSKINLRLNLTNESANYLGDPGFFIFSAPVRRDRTRSSTLSLSYMPLLSTEIDLSLQTGQQTSTYSINDYKYNSVFANFRVDF
jgi:hypothetical protein